MQSKFAYCKVSISPVRAENKDQSEMVTQLLFGEVIEIKEIIGNWTQIVTYFDNYEGWIDTKHFQLLTEKEMKKWLNEFNYQNEIIQIVSTPWGNQRIIKGSFVSLNKSVFLIGNQEFKIEKKEIQVKTLSIFETAKEYLNTPYLWGGKSPFGIDCSGLTQQVFRFFDINLPRDASQQVEHGLTIPFEEIESGDVAFFHNKEGKIIHVGILNANGEIIHASGCVRIDLITPTGIINNETNELTHHLSVIKRFV